MTQRRLGQNGGDAVAQRPLYRSRMCRRARRGLCTAARLTLGGQPDGRNQKPSQQKRQKQPINFHARSLTGEWLVGTGLTGCGETRDFGWNWRKVSLRG